MSEQKNLETPPIRESLADHLIRIAEKNGAFSGLPGSGKPLEALDESYDELWWAKQLVRREQLTELSADEQWAVSIKSNSTSAR